MKKSGFLIFITALTVGLMFSAGCSLSRFKNTGGTQNSGNVKTEQLNLSGFSKIKASGAVEIEVTAQKNFAVEVTAAENLLPLVKTELNGDTLKISSPDKISSQSKISLKISLPQLEQLELTGASTANVENVKEDSLELTANGASKITASGAAGKLKLQSNGASSIDAENLQAEKADAEANGASSATVSAAEELKAEANGASSINYTGNPKNLNQKTGGVSSISKK